MQEITKTTCFVATAVVLALVAYANSYLNQPGTSESAELVGTPFYPDFTSTESARALEVSAIDPETGALKRFGVESDGDLWRIPTHYDYPAEAAARIAQTSASVMGLERQAIVGMSESEFERFGVVDPLSDDVEDPETAGKRITLKDENGDPLVDYIIGKEVEDAVPTRNGDEFDIEQNDTDFYVRRADDSQTFQVSLNLDLSTRFSDWIDPDLLRISSADVTEVSINNYTIEERGAGAFGMTELFKDQGDQLLLTRPSPAEQWMLEGLEIGKEEVQTTRVNEILGVLDQMKIAGVRPKFKFEGKQLLTGELVPADIPEFKKDPEKAANAYRSLQNDLMDKGFNFGGSNEKLELLSENGELEFGTSKGLRYRLHIGSAVSDDDETIEIGSGEKKESEAKEEAESTEESSAEESSTEDANRFLYVRVTFDESLLGDRPAEPKAPQEPIKPEGYTPAPPAEKEEAKEGEEKPEGEGESQDKPETEQRNPQFVMYEEALALYEKANSEHEMNLTRYKQDNEAFDKKIEEGKKLVDELNQRFGDWYYVITASNLNTIQSVRADLVKPVEVPEGAVPATPPAPDISFPDIPGGGTFQMPQEKPADAKADAESKEEPAAEKDNAEKPAEPAADQEKSETKSDGSEPTTESPEKKPDSEKESDSGSNEDEQR